MVMMETSKSMVPYALSYKNVSIFWSFERDGTATFAGACTLHCIQCSCSIHLSATASVDVWMSRRSNRRGMQYKIGCCSSNTSHLLIKFPFPAIDAILTVSVKPMLTGFCLCSLIWRTRYYYRSCDDQCCHDKCDS